MSRRPTGELESLQAVQQGKRPAEHFLMCLTNAGLVERRGGKLVVTPEGYKFLRVKGDWSRMDDDMPSVRRVARVKQ